MPFHPVRRSVLSARHSLCWVAVTLGTWATAAQAADGEVKKIDSAQAKITLKHGPIDNLEMPAMTMVFRVKPASLLTGLAVGDEVEFSAEMIEGFYVVTALRKRR